MDILLTVKNLNNTKKNKYKTKYTYENILKL